MPKVEGPMRSANQAVVAGSCWTMAKPPRRKVSTSASFPGFASRRTYSALLTIFPLSFSFGLDSLGSCEAVPAAAVAACLFRDSAPKPRDYCGDVDNSVVRKSGAGGFLSLSHARRVVTLSAGVQVVTLSNCGLSPGEKL